MKKMTLCQPAPAMLWLVAVIFLMPAVSLANTPPSSATAGSSHPVTSNQSHNTELGNINVKAMQHLVKALQQVKVALHTPFSDNPRLVDQMVCLLGSNQPGHRSTPILECGTQGWYSMQREATQLVLLSGQASVPDHGHPWHTVRVLNHTQLMYLRQLLKDLPPPATDVQVIEELGRDPVDNN